MHLLLILLTLFFYYLSVIPKLRGKGETFIVINEEVEKGKKQEKGEGKKEKYKEKDKKD